ncbi:MAG: Heat shock protein 70 [Gemmatimonadales bacterium]|nr:Heat shock protein 70 [Gemmatimonadales bacterium]
MSFGIDFGTTNSVLAYFDGKDAHAVPVDKFNLDEWSYPSFERLFPSVVGYSSTRPELLFGWEAKLRSEENVEAVKRLLRGDDEVILADKGFAASTVVAGFFDTLRSRAAGHDLDLDRAVVTVPANSTGAARYRTRAAARVGGVQVQALLNEPTAAAIAYVHDVGRPERILVFDWGGGTVDVTVLEYADGLFEEQATRGIAELGGLEIDKRLAKLVLKKLGKTPSWGPVEWAQFRRDIERTKIRLSTEEFVVMNTPDFSRTIEVEREEFEAGIADLVQQGARPLRDCLAQLRIGPADLDAVLMIGGTSQIPLVRQRVAEILDEEPVSSEVCEPLTAVARGAAIAAAILKGDLESDISVATTHALGTVSEKVKGQRTFSEIIPRNATLPRRERKTYRPSKDAQRSFNLEIWEGDPRESLDSPDNFLLTEIVVPFPGLRSREENQFTLGYAYDKNGLLHVKAVLDRTQDVLLDYEVQYFGESGAGVGASPETLRNLLQVNAGVTAHSEIAVPASMDDEPEFSTNCYIVDGPNVAWLGQNDRPSHTRLTEAVEALAKRFPGAEIHTVVDAMFTQMVARDEQSAAAADCEAGRLIELPRGAVGGVRAFILSLAAEKNAIIVSNESFGDFEAEHAWLREPSRVVGVTVAAGIWMFTPRKAL